jgi:ABC-type transport system involved in multi-copper enzyme maturation permease subunit
MLKLLRKDLILNGKVIGATYLFWSVLWLGFPIRDYGEKLSPAMWAGMVSVACAFLPVMMIGREDKFKAAALACSLPVTRKDIVLSRYAGGWLVALVAAAVAVAAMLLLSSWGVVMLAGPVTMVPVVATVVMGIVLALMMPLALRFGIAGVIGILVALQLLGVVTLLAGAMFGGGDFIRVALRGIASVVTRTHEALGPTGLAAASVAAVLALNIASCRLSILVYRRQDF